MGTVAGAWMPLIFTVLFALGTLSEGLNGDGSLWQSLWLAVSPITVTLPTVLASCVFFGLPTVQLLRFLAAESERNYVAAGIFFGSLVPLAILLSMDAQDGWWLALLGAFSGGICGATWWRSTVQA